MTTQTEIPGAERPQQPELEKLILAHTKEKEIRMKHGRSEKANKDAVLAWLVEHVDDLEENQDGEPCYVSIETGQEYYLTKDDWAVKWRAHQATPASEDIG